jgi:ankyrin repeat protein
MIKLQILILVVYNFFAADIQSKSCPEYQFFRAAAAGNLNQVQKLFLQVGIDAKSKSGQTALMYAAAAGKKNIVDFLLVNGANYNHQDTIGSTALTLASEEGKFAIIMSLISAGANSNLQNTHGDNALHIASALGHKNAIRILQANGTLNCPNIAGRTPLHQAAFFGHSNIISDLADTTSINQRTNDRFKVTALELAAFRNHFQVVKALIAEKGHCYFSVRGALRAAILRGNEQIIAAMRDYEVQDEIQNQAVMLTSTPIDWQSPIFMSAAGLQQFLQHQGSNPLIPQTRQRLTGYIDFENGLLAARNSLAEDARPEFLCRVLERLNDKCAITLQSLVLPRQTVFKLLETFNPEVTTTLPDQVSFTGNDLVDLIKK